MVLSGALDDGTSGLWTVKRLGGLSVVQHPEEAAFDSMPLSAMDAVEIDHTLSAAEIGPLLARWATSPAPRAEAASVEDRKKVEVEVAVAANGDAFRRGVMTLGEFTPFTCPECHGALVKIKEGGTSRFRCHTGHAYTPSALLAGVMEAIGEGYWQVMRALEEAVMLLDDMGRQFADAGQPEVAERFFAKAREADERARWLRETTLHHDHVSGDSLCGPVAGP